jgi:hypothetical protein
MAIEVLPDEVLLEIFDLGRINEVDHRPWEWAKKWARLTQVCRKWRQLIFSSPLRLNLRIFCQEGTPVRKNLCIWPAIPIAIRYGNPWSGIRRSDEDNVIAALEHPDRLCHVWLNVNG